MNSVKIKLALVIAANAVAWFVSGLIVWTGDVEPVMEFVKGKYLILGALHTCSLILLCQAFAATRKAKASRYWLIFEGALLVTTLLNIWVAYTSPVN